MESLSILSQIDSGQALEKLQPGQLVRIALPLIQPRADQPRKHFEQTSLERLAASLKAGGDVKQAIQVIIKHDGKGSFYAELKTGERRFRAAQMAGLTAIKSEIMPGISEREVHLDSTAENLNRLGLNYMEMAYAGRRIIADFPELKTAEIADRLGVSESYLNYCLKFLKLHPDFQELMLIGQFNHQIAAKLADFPPRSQFGVLEELNKHASREIKKGKRVSHTKIAKDVRKVAEKAKIKTRQNARGKKFLPHGAMVIRNFERAVAEMLEMLPELKKVDEDKLVFSKLGIVELRKQITVLVDDLKAQLQRIRKIKNVS